MTRSPSNAQRRRRISERGERKSRFASTTAFGLFFPQKFCSLSFLSPFFLACCFFFPPLFSLSCSLYPSLLPPRLPKQRELAASAEEKFREQAKKAESERKEEALPLFLPSTPSSALSLLFLRVFFFKFFFFRLFTKCFLSPSRGAVPCVLAARAHKQSNALQRSAKGKGQRPRGEGCFFFGALSSLSKNQGKTQREGEGGSENLFSFSLSRARAPWTLLSLSLSLEWQCWNSKSVSSVSNVFVSKIFFFEIFFSCSRSFPSHAAAPLACLSLDPPLLDPDAGGGGLCW